MEAQSSQVNNDLFTTIVLSFPSNLRSEIISWVYFGPKRAAWFSVWWLSALLSTEKTVTSQLCSLTPTGHWWACASAISLHKTLNWMMSKHFCVASISLRRRLRQKWWKTISPRIRLFYFVKMLKMRASYETYMFAGGWVVSELQALYELRSASFTRPEKCSSHIIIITEALSPTR